MSRAPSLASLGLNSVAGQWRQWRSLFVDPTAPADHVSALEAAFFSGAMSLIRLREGVQADVQRGKVRREAAMAIDEGWTDEVRRWAIAHVEKSGTQVERPKAPGEETPS